MDLFPGVAIYPYVCLQIAVLLLNLTGLPANWFILAIIAGADFLLPPPLGLVWWQWLILLALNVACEILVKYLKIRNVKKSGASSSGLFGAFLGAICGAIFISPVLGALCGALTGSWLGCFCNEKLLGKDNRAATRGANFAFLSYFSGTSLRLLCGALLIFLSANWLMPNALPYWDNAPGGEDNTEITDV